MVSVKKTIYLEIVAGMTFCLVVLFWVATKMGLDNVNQQYLAQQISELQRRIGPGPGG